MSVSGEEEVFFDTDTGASPELVSPDKRRRSTRTSTRKRASTGAAPYSRPKRMSTRHTPPPGKPGSTSTGHNGPTTKTGAPASCATPVDHPTLKIPSGPPRQPPDFMHQMQQMLGGMLEGRNGEQVGEDQC